MTSYNALKYIEYSIASIINQSYINWELILVENGSNDGTQEVIKKITDERVKVFYLEKNIGRTAALNFALKKANGPYVAVLDADDISKINRIEVQVDYLDNNLGVGLVASWAQVIDVNGKIIKTAGKKINDTDLIGSLAWTNPIIHSSVMYRKELALSINGYPRRFKWSQDYAFYISMAKTSTLHVIPKYLIEWRVNPSGMSMSDEVKILKYKELICNYRRACRLINFDDKSRKLSKASQFLNNVILSILYLNKSDLTNFKKYLLKSKSNICISIFNRIYYYFI